MKYSGLALVIIGGCILGATINNLVIGLLGATVLSIGGVVVGKEYAKQDTQKQDTQ